MRMGRLCVTASTSMAESVFGWWLALSVVGVLNPGIWLLIAGWLRRKAGSMPRAEYVARRRQLWLSGVYVVGCSFRSFLPRADVQRICLFDTWLSSVMVGRWVATVAELAFALQWALFLRELAGATGARFALGVSRWLVPVIAFAELSSWYAVLTTNFLGNAIEQSSWTFSAILLGISFATLRTRLTGEARGVATAGVASTLLFVTFMCNVDVPMYLSRWLNDEAVRQTYRSLPDGWHDAAARWIVTWQRASWRGEMLWMSLYFSLGVWASMALTGLPRPAASDHVALRDLRRHG
jgi:hypothetical protein